jgi:hypothetical protein
MIKFRNFLEQKSPNFVAKNAHKYNKAVVHTDKKKDLKKGYVKHKGTGS